MGRQSLDYRSVSPAKRRQPLWSRLILWAVVLAPLVVLAASLLILLMHRIGFRR